MLCVSTFIRDLGAFSSYFYILFDLADPGNIIKKPRTEIKDAVCVRLFLGLKSPYRFWCIQLFYLC